VRERSEQYLLAADRMKEISKRLREAARAADNAARSFRAMAALHGKAGVRACAPSAARETEAASEASDSLRSWDPFDPTTFSLPPVCLDADHAWTGWLKCDRCGGFAPGQLMKVDTSRFRLENGGS
jgi:hypothetical protein